MWSFALGHTLRRVQPVVIAHRTCPRDAPENSLLGIAMAAALAADAVEVDVRRSADGVPVLLHDRRLLRTTGRLAGVAALPVAELGRIRLRGGGTVPTLAEALSALGPTMRIAIDVKDPGAGPAVIEVVRAPAVGEAAVTHRWAGVLALSRDRWARVGYDARSGVGWAGGYAGYGVAASNLAGRTLADLVLGRDSELLALPWVGLPSPKWPIEPVRWLWLHGSDEGRHARDWFDARLG